MKTIRGIELVAVAAVMSRDLTVFSKTWRSATFAAVVEPLVFLVGFGFGIGAIVSQVAGIDYIEFLGTGIVASAVLFSSALPGMFQTFVKRRFQRVYDAVLAAPVDVSEIVTAEVLWIAARAGVYGTGPMLVAMLFGLDPAWGMLLVPLIGFLTGFGFAAFGVAAAAISSSIDNFNYVSSGILTPLLLLAGVFFPLEKLPPWVEVVAWLNPLYHCVQLVRDAVIYGLGLIDLAHVGVLVIFAVAMWGLAVAKLRPELID